MINTAQPQSNCLDAFRNDSTMLSESISRRYTPPTCTLEISAQTSALSRWAGRPVVKQLQFQLSFDNLLRADDQPVQISGDRTQLDSLCEVVESYVQERLNQFPADWHSLLPADPAVGQSDTVVDQPDTFEPVPVGLWPRVTDGVGQTTGVPDTEVSETQGIYLQQKNPLFHDLFPGSLATETSGSVIKLSTSQLFDLASALEEYAAEAIALPVKQPPVVAWVQGTPIWARTAAIAVVAVGITTAALQLTNSNSISQRREPSSTASPTVPPPPPSGAIQPTVPTDLPTVSIPSNLPSIEPPPATPISPEAVPKSSPSGEAPQVAVKPAPKQDTVIQPRSNPSKSQMTISKADPETSTGNNAARTTSPSATQSQSKERLFDVSTQVAEVREYFESRWQPSQELTQSLQYTLILRPNGSVLRTVPIGQAAKTYYLNGKTPIPLDEPVASPVKEGGYVRIRLRLDPDGSVETFPESSN